MSGRSEILGVDRRKALVSLGVALVLLVVAGSDVGRVADFGRLRAASEAAGKWWFLVCLAGLVCAYAGYIVGYREVAGMDGGPKLPFRIVTGVVGIGFGAQVLGSSVGGLAVDFWALHRAGLGVHESARRVLGFNTLDWALLGAFVTVAAVLVLAGRGAGAPLAMTLTWIVACRCAWPPRHGSAPRSACAASPTSETPIRAPLRATSAADFAGS